MSDDVEVKLYLDHVQVTVEDATDEVLKALAFRIQERAQMNIRENDQIDTGFLVNSVYVSHKSGSGYGDAKSNAEDMNKDQDGNIVDHTGDMADEATLPSDAIAAVVVGANYAVYQENINSFLYPAAEVAAAEFRGEAEKIYKEELPDEGPTP